jgi:hypothetical protein
VKAWSENCGGSASREEGLTGSLARVVVTPRRFAVTKLPQPCTYCTKAEGAARQVK